jgi:hypothetical protein
MKAVKALSNGCYEINKGKSGQLLQRKMTFNFQITLPINQYVCLQGIKNVLQIFPLLREHTNQKNIMLF